MATQFPDHDQEEDLLIEHAIEQLAASLETTKLFEPSMDSQDLIWQSCLYITHNLGIECKKPPIAPEPKTAHNWLLAIANESQFQIRKIKLKGQWWTYDNGPLLLFDQKHQLPKVLLWQYKKGYTVIDPKTGESTPLTPNNALELMPFGYCFYPALPDEPIRLRNFLKFIFKGRREDLIHLTFLQLGIGLIGLLAPIATGILLDKVIPNAEIGMLGQWIIILVCSAFAIALFNAAKLVGLTRIRFKITAYTQAAIWDRLLRQSVHFFKQFSPGDLGVRAEGMDQIQQEVSTSTLQTILSGIFSVLTLGLMFFYSVWLALLALAIVAITVLLMIIAAKIQLRYQRPLAYLKGKLASLSLQFLNAISKLHISHSESRMYAIWAEMFARKNNLHLKGSLWSIYFSLVNNFIPLLGIIGLFGIVGVGAIKISFGSFIAFNTAYAQFTAATISMTEIVITLIQLIPLYERIKPVLETVPEPEKKGVQLIPLEGHIQLKDVSFNYFKEGENTLEKINLYAKPGQMIALAGPTGSGKSTIIRLLLGFEQPASGHIEYDQHELAVLNIRVLRAQISVILQNSSLLPGTIFDNIRGNKLISLEEAWEAAEQAGLTDTIKAMPMKMQTLVAENAKTFSTGQRQRLLIARALARKPKVLILDEATSALDNPTQHLIMQELAKLNMTRILIAHRLSTLVHADYIYVLDHGKVVQSGTYNNLIEQEGIFRELVRRQSIGE
jgi:NHLM bacteriocin system ABC transporter ATP-binding protein